MTTSLDPQMDGVDHVNIYSRSRCELGRVLSNFTRTAFIDPCLGRFESMEGFYYYVATGMRDETLRALWGYQAKTYGVKLPKVHHDAFLDIMDQGLRSKVRCNGHIKEALRESALPFAHYYVFGEGSTAKVVVPKGDQWLVNSYDVIRKEIQAEAFL